MSFQTNEMCEPEVYLKKHHLMTYLEDAVTFLLERREEDPKTRPYELLAEYFESVKKGTHILFRDYSFISMTPHNRASFIRLFWYSFSEVASRGDSMRVMEYLSLLRLLCHNFPSDMIQKVARVIFSYDAMENMIGFPDFLYAFQVLFYYEVFLSRCEVVCADIHSGQTPLDLLDGSSTVVVSMPSTGEHTGGGGEGGGGEEGGGGGRGTKGREEGGVGEKRPDTSSSMQSVLSSEEDMTRTCSSQYRSDSPLNGDVFLKAVTSLCLRIEKEPQEQCPSIDIITELMGELTSVTFYDFVLALSRSERVNGEIGALPERSELLTAGKSAVFHSSPINHHKLSHKK